MFSVIVGIVCGVVGFYLGMVVMACAIDQKDHIDE